MRVAPEGTPAHGGGRLPHHPRGPLAAPLQARRDPAALERGARRHVAGGTPPRGAALRRPRRAALAPGARRAARPDRSGDAAAARRGGTAGWIMEAESASTASACCPGSCAATATTWTPHAWIRPRGVLGAGPSWPSAAVPARTTLARGTDRGEAVIERRSAQSLRVRAARPFWSRCCSGRSSSCSTSPSWRARSSSPTCCASTSSCRTTSCLALLVQLPLVMLLQFLALAWRGLLLRLALRRPARDPGLPQGGGRLGGRSSCSCASGSTTATTSGECRCR